MGQAVHSDLAFPAYCTACTISRYLQAKLKVIFNHFFKGKTTE